jgi:hypothetical protein
VSRCSRNHRISLRDSAQEPKGARAHALALSVLA